MLSVLSITFVGEHVEFVWFPSPGKLTLLADRDGNSEQRTPVLGPTQTPKRRVLIGCLLGAAGRTF